MKTLAEIEAEVARLSERIAAPGNAYPTFGYSADFARPHIEIGAANIITLPLSGARRYSANRHPIWMNCCTGYSMA